MKLSPYKFALILGLGTFSLNVLAQDKKDETKPAEPGALTEEIEVVRPYKPVLADAVKIRRNPDMNDDRKFMPVLTYAITDKKLELNSNIKELQAQKVQDERPPVLQNNYAKVGGGSLGTLLGELYMNTGRNADLQAGAWVKHLGQEGSLEKQQYSRQEIGAFAKSIRVLNTISGSLRYDRHSTYFYGFDRLGTTLVDPQKQRFGTIAAQAELASNYSEESPFFYSVGLNGYSFSNINNSVESSFGLTGAVSQEFGMFNAGVNASADLTNAKDEAYNIGNNFLRANPYISYDGNGFRVTAGANIVQNYGDLKTFNIFPAISAEIPLGSQNTYLFAGLKGDVIKSSLREFAYDNHFLNENTALVNSVEQMNVYGGLKGNVGAGLGFKVMAFQKQVDDLPLYVSADASGNRFDVIYDQKAKILGVEGELNLKASDFLDLIGKAQFFDYKLQNNERAWLKPGIRISSQARAQINQKFYIDAEVLMQGETYARIEDPAGTFSARKLTGFIDLSTGAEYRITNKVGVYIRATNLLGQSYQRLLNYDSLGMSVFGGVNFGF